MAPKKRKSLDLSTYSGRFAQKLRKTREAKGYTVPEMVERIVKYGYEITESNYYKWENKNAVPPLDAMPAVAKALKLKSVKGLFPGE